MYKTLAIQLPWTILSDLVSPSTLKFNCWRTEDEKFELQVIRETDFVCFNFSGNFSRDDQIIVDNYCSVSGKNENGDSNSKSVGCQYAKRPVQNSKQSEVHELITGKVRPKSTRKRKTKDYDDFICSDSIQDPNEIILDNSNVANNALSGLAINSGSEPNVQYTCKACGEVCQSLSPRSCIGAKKHGDYKTWTCNKCHYSTEEHTATSPSDSSLTQETSSILATEVIKSSTSDAKKKRLSPQDGKELAQEPGKQRSKKMKVEIEGSKETLEGADGTNTVAIEIVMEKASLQEKQTLDRGVLNKESVVLGKGDNAAANIVDHNDGLETENQPCGVTILGAGEKTDIVDHSVQARLHTVAKNYQIYIEEYCSIVNHQFQCKMCSGRFRKMGKFMDHLYKAHEECQPYYCLLCDFRTRGKSNVFTHNSYKHNDKERPFSCECGTTCLTKSKYEVHLATHNDRSEFKCEQCESVFTTKNGRTEHVRRLHGGRFFPCGQCDKKFTTPHSRKIHENVHQPGRRWKCLYCQKLYRSEQSLKIHMHTHTTVFHCQICDKDIYSYSAFIGHRNLHDPKTRKHPCSVCDKLFPTKKARDKHVILNHSKTNHEHKCPVCEKSFKLLEQLNSHMICHSQSKPWVCEVCGQAFKRQSTMCTHRNKHGQQNRAPFICTFCQQEFPSYDVLAEHLVNEEKAGLCQYCHRLFSSRPLLDQHIVSAHHQQINESVTSALDEYITERIGELESQDEEKLFDSGLSVLGPSLINETQTHALVETPIQIAPSKVKTKVIHSGRNSCVVAQIRTTPVIRSSKRTRFVDSRDDETKSSDEQSMQSVTVTHADGETVEIPVITAGEVQRAVSGIIETP